MNDTPHINRTRVKRTALEIASNTRAQGFKHVRLSFLKRIEIATINAIRREVAQHPSKGKSLL